MRVLHVISSFGLGGSENIAVNVCARLQNEHNVHIQTIRRTSTSEHAVAEARKRELDAAGVRWREGRAPSQRLSPLSAPFELAETIFRLRPHIVHSHTDVPDFCLSLTRRFMPFKTARTIHNTKLWESRRWSGWLAESGFQDDLVVGINQETLEAYRELRRDLGLSRSRFERIIANGVPMCPAEEYHDVKWVQKALHADPSKLQIIFVGRLEHQKGLDILLDALDRLPLALAQKLEVHVVGDGPQRADAEKRAAANAMLHIHGALPEAHRWLKAFQLVVMPSRFEGLGLVAAEALMAGVPVLISDVPGLRTVVPADWPLKVPSEDPVALARKLAAFVRGETVAPALPAGWLDKFDVDVMAQSYLRTYQEYLEALRTERPSKIFPPPNLPSSAPPGSPGEPTPNTPPARSLGVQSLQ